MQARKTAAGHSGSSRLHGAVAPPSTAVHEPSPFEPVAEVVDAGALCQRYPPLLVEPVGPRASGTSTRKIRQIDHSGVWGIGGDCALSPSGRDEMDEEDRLNRAIPPRTAPTGLGPAGAVTEHVDRLQTSTHRRSPKYGDQRDPEKMGSHSPQGFRTLAVVGSVAGVGSHPPFGGIQACWAFDDLASDLAPILDFAGALLRHDHVPLRSTRSLVRKALPSDRGRPRSGLPRRDPLPTAALWPRYAWRRRRLQLRDVWTHDEPLSRQSLPSHSLDVPTRSDLSAASLGNTRSACTAHCSP